MRPYIRELRFLVAGGQCVISVGLVKKSKREREREKKIERNTGIKNPRERNCVCESSNDYNASFRQNTVSACFLG